MIIIFNITYCTGSDINQEIIVLLQIQDVLNNEKLKRELLAQLIVKFEGAVLEHDSNNAAFLFEMNDFHWILQIDIGE